MSWRVDFAERNFGPVSNIDSKCHVEPFEYLRHIDQEWSKSVNLTKDEMILYETLDQYLPADRQ